MSQEILVYDLTEISIPVMIKEKDGTENKYLLKEASGLGGRTFKDMLAAKVDINQVTKMVTPKEGMNQLEPILVAMCLYPVGSDTCLYDQIERDTNGRQTRPGLQRVQGWPDRVTSSLYKQAQSISGLDDKGEKEAKKE